MFVFQMDARYKVLDEWEIRSRSAGRDIIKDRIFLQKGTEYTIFFALPFVLGTNDLDKMPVIVRRLDSQIVRSKAFFKGWIASTKEKYRGHNISFAI